MDSKNTTVCSLHFKSGRKTYETNVPTIFPWNREWADVVQRFNNETEDWFEKQQTNDHNYAKKPPVLRLTTMSNTSTSQRKSRNSRKTQEVIYYSKFFTVIFYAFVIVKVILAKELSRFSAQQSLNYIPSKLITMNIQHQQADYIKGHLLIISGFQFFY